MKIKPLRLHGLHGVHDDLAKHGALGADELRGQRGLGDVHQRVLLQRVHLQAQVLLTVPFAFKVKLKVRIRVITDSNYLS